MESYWGTVLLYSADKLYALFVEVVLELLSRNCPSSQLLPPQLLTTTSECEDRSSICRAQRELSREFGREEVTD